MAEITHSAFTDVGIRYGSPVGDNQYMLCVEKDAEILFLTRNQLRTILNSVEDMMLHNDFEQPENEPNLEEL